MNNSVKKRCTKILGISFAVAMLLLSVGFLSLLATGFVSGEPVEVHEETPIETGTTTETTTETTTYTTTTIITTTTTTTSTETTSESTTTEVTTTTTKTTPVATEKPTETITETTETTVIIPASKYEGITDEEYRMLVLAVYLESGNQSYSCKEAVASVIMNRVYYNDTNDFPDTIMGVLTQKNQFTIDLSRTDTPDGDCYRAVDSVLSNGSVLPYNVLFFYADYCNSSWLLSRQVYCKIGNVYFAY